MLCWQAVRGVPAGQAAGMVQFVADGLPALVDGSPEVAAPLGEVRLSPWLQEFLAITIASGSTAGECFWQHLLLLHLTPAQKVPLSAWESHVGGKSVCQVLLKNRCSYVWWY